MHALAAKLCLAQLPLVFIFCLMLDRPYKTTRTALALDLATVMIGWAILLDWFVLFLLII